MNNETLLQHLQTNFGHSKFKSISQRNAIEAAIEGKSDIFISMPTGSGKSLCFQLPGVLQENKVTIVFTPFLASIKDQLDHLSKLNIVAASLNSHMDFEERDDIVEDLTSPNPTIKFLYLTPEMATIQSELIELLVNSGKVAYFVVDEAHMVSQNYCWSHSFRPDVSKLSEIRTGYPDIPWIVMTAAASNEVVDDIFNQLKLKKPIAYFKIPSFRENLYYDVVFEKTSMIEDEIDQLKEFIMDCKSDNNSDVFPCGIIYCRTANVVENMVKDLKRNHVPVTLYHTNMEPSQRIQAQEDWISGKFPVICATECFDMVDKASVQFVIHWNLPRNLFTYYLESGRAGRDCQQAFCRIYFRYGEMQWFNSVLQRRINNSETSLEIQEAEIAKEQFENVIEYCQQKLCRHKSFSQYFDDPQPQCGESCDACRNQSVDSASMDDSDGSDTEN